MAGSISSVCLSKYFYSVIRNITLQNFRSMTVIRAQKTFPQLVSLWVLSRQTNRHGKTFGHKQKAIEGDSEDNEHRATQKNTEL